MNYKSHAPLRLLLVTAGRTIPNWLYQCLRAVEQSRAATLVLVLQADQAERGSRGSVLSRLRSFSFWLYKKLDRYLFRSSPDALAPIDVRSALPNCRVVEAAELPERVDVVLDPFSVTSDGRLADLARYGVWSTTFGPSGDARTQSAPGFWEVIEGRPSTETRLCIHRKGADRRVSLYVSVAPTDRRSTSRNQNHIYWKMSAALTSNIQRLWADPEAFLQRLEAAAPFEASGSPSLVPGNLAMLRAGSSLIRRYVADTGMRTLYREQWALAYQHGGGDHLVMEAFRKLMPPRDRYWADPFPVQVGSDYYLFHEEFRFAIGKGSIVLTVVGDTASLARPVPVLEQEYHLSYPFVFQWDGEFFMIPQTASHRVELYRCVDFPAHWKLERVLLSGLTASDPTPAFLFGRWWLFATVPAYGATRNHDELHLFHADSPLGPWTPHRNNPIKSDVRSARPAGRIFESHGQFLRPAQDCSERYGYAVSINRILQLDPETYREVEVEKILPNWEPNVVGVHTFNRAADMTVIDCLVRTRRGSRAYSRQVPDGASAHRPNGSPLTAGRGVPSVGR